MRRSLMSEMTSKVGNLESKLHSVEGKLHETEYELKVARQDGEARATAASRATNELEALRRELATERAASSEKIDLLTKAREDLTRQTRELEVRTGAARPHRHRTPPDDPSPLLSGPPHAHPLMDIPSSGSSSRSCSRSCPWRITISLAWLNPPFLVSRRAPCASGRRRSTPSSAPPVRMSRYVA